MGQLAILPYLRNYSPVPKYAVAEAAEVLAVSDDTVRRWIDTGRLAAHRDQSRIVIDGVDLAELAERLLEPSEALERGRTRAHQVSARNRMSGIVTRVKTDTVMAQVEMVCGPYRLVSLMSSDAAADLGLAPGVRAIASVKSTNVVMEVQ